MARKPKHSLGKGEARTPEEHRRILAVLDQEQRDRSGSGKALSKKRIANTFGVSQSKHNAKSAPKNKKRAKIYEVGRYCGE